MKSAIFFLFGALFPFFVEAQQSDMLALKKRNNRTVETFFAGKNISFAYADGQWMKGRIHYIARDSVFLQFFDIRRIPTPYGTFSIDTVAILPFTLHYRDMVAFPRKKESFPFIRNGLLMKLGGGGYILLNVVNGRYLNERIGSKENMRSLGIAAGTLGLGFLLGALYRPYLQVGRHYRLHYISLTR